MHGGHVLQGRGLPCPYRRVADLDLSCALQNQGHMERDLRQMESMVEDMRRRNDPLTAHYERQTLIVKTRKEQLGDMYCGYAAAISV